MVSPLGFALGFASAVIAIAVPLGKLMWDLRQDTHRALLLLRGTESMDRDGVIPRLRRVENLAERNAREVGTPVNDGEHRDD